MILTSYEEARLRELAAATGRFNSARHPSNSPGATRGLLRKGLIIAKGTSRASTGRIREHGELYLTDAGLQWLAENPIGKAQQ